LIFLKKYDIIFIGNERKEMVNMKEMYVVYDREAIDLIEDVECECVVETEADAQEMIFDLTMEDMYYMFLGRVQHPFWCRTEDGGLRPQTIEEALKEFKRRGLYRYYYQPVRVP
jgi:hypothetical protein